MNQPDKDKLDHILATCRAAIALSEKATPGPWRFYTKPQPNGCPIIGNHKGLMVAILAHSVNEPTHKEEGLVNAEFIATSRTLCPQLAQATITAVEGLQKLMNEATCAGDVWVKQDCKTALLSIINNWREE